MRRDPWDNPMTRVTDEIGWFLTVGFLVFLAVLPGVLPMVLLERSPSNAPLFALCALPIGPALSAGILAMRDKDLPEFESPLRSFVRGYRVNAFDALRIWIPAVAVVAAIGFAVSTLRTTDLPGALAVALVVIAAAICLLTAQSLVITSLFNFRTRDVVRLAAYYAAVKPLQTLAVGLVLVLTAGLSYLTINVIAVLISPVLIWLVLKINTPIIEDLKDNFTS